MTVVCQGGAQTADCPNGSAQKSCFVIIPCMNTMYSYLRHRANYFKCKIPNYNREPNIQDTRQS